MNFTNSMVEPTENKWPVPQGETIEPAYRGTSNATWVFIVALTVALVGLACIGYFTFKKTTVQITQLFGNQAAVNTLDQRVGSAESKILDVAGKWEGVGQRLTKLESRINHNIQQTRAYAESLTDRMHKQVTAEIQASTSVIDTRLNQVESDEAAQRSQLTRVEAELQQQIASAREETGRDLSGVHQQVESNAYGLHSLSERLDRKRVDFEVGKGLTTELVPGVSLQISGTNNKYQRFHGSLWLLQDHRTLWLRDESAHEPVRFYHKNGGEPYELVVTDVTKRSVVGYLLVPKEQQAGANPSPDGEEKASSTFSNN